MQQHFVHQQIFRQTLTMSCFLKNQQNQIRIRRESTFSDETGFGFDPDPKRNGKIRIQSGPILIRCYLCR